MCVFVFDLWMFLFIYDRIAKNKEEFNILICSRLRIMSLDINRISNIRLKTIIKTSLTHQSHEAAYLR
jgi:hypothetical protein